MNTMTTNDNSMLVKQYCCDGEKHNLLFVKSSDEDGDDIIYKTDEYWNHIANNLPNVGNMSFDIEQLILQREIDRSNMYFDKLKTGEIEPVACIYPEEEIDDKKSEHDMDNYSDCGSCLGSDDYMNGIDDDIQFDDDGNIIYSDASYSSEDDEYDARPIYYKPSRTFATI